jgi:tRNA pseudouridine13 synthase
MGNLLSRSTSQGGKGSKRSLDPEDANSNYNKKARLDEEIITIKESDVGIVAFVNPHLKGFHSILKYRYVYKRACDKKKNHPNYGVFFYHLEPRISL